jgi:hypothetical protein
MGFVIPSERRLWGGVGFVEIFTKASLNFLNWRTGGSSSKKNPPKQSYKHKPFPAMYKVDPQQDTVNT